MLSDSRISSLYFEALGSQHLREQDRKMVTRFAHAVESEVRKQDDALIRNFVDAIKLDRHDWEDWPEDSREAFDALINALPFDSCSIQRNEYGRKCSSSTIMSSR